MTSATVPLGVCVWLEAEQNRARTVGYPNYVFEILNHAGVFHTVVRPDELPQRLAQLRVLVTVGDTELSNDIKRDLKSWIESGGAWLSVAGTCGMEDCLSAVRSPPTYASWGGGFRSLGEGYLAPPRSDHPALEHITRPLHYFGGIALQNRDATILARATDAHGRPIDPPAVIERIVGRGRCMLIAPDVTGTIVRIQQGCGAVTRDGVPAPDGTSPVNDNVLKSDDGAVLDWLFDRDPVPGADGLSMFAQPIADLWRELLLRSIFHLATTQDVSLPLLWLYPRQLPAIGHLSHDTDNNEPAKAERLLQTLAAGEVKSTWCVILPGYEPPLMQRIRSAGHEFATHFDSMSEGCPWGEEHFDRQWRELKKLFGETPVTNKNHYLRWEGDTDLWEWCAKRGIQLDQTKGASKSGEAGFNFGTCHPYFPVRFDGSTIDVLELPTPTQDLCVFAPEAILEPLIAGVRQSHGILHLLFHPAHFGRDEVANAMASAIRRGKEERLEWWTARQINHWERSRRKVRLVEYNAASVTLSSEEELRDATVLKLSRETTGLTLIAWGFTFEARTQTLRGSTRIDFD